MSTIAAYRELKDNISTMTARLAQMETDPKLKHEMEFETKLKDLMAEYGKSLTDIISIMAPELLPSVKAATPRRPRQMKVYVNPNTQERIETKGGNHAQLKMWKAEYGADTVESWLEK